MDVLNFSTPLGNYKLNFGGDDYQGYLKFSNSFILDYKQYPIVYFEFDWLYNVEDNLTRFFRLNIKNSGGLVVAKASTPLLKYTENKKVALSIDLTEYKHLDILLTSEIYVEEILKGSVHMGIDNLKIYIGKTNE